MNSYLVSKIGALAAKDMTNLASVMEGRLFSHEGGKGTWIRVVDGTSPSNLEHLKSALGEVKSMRLKVKVKIQNFPTCHVFMFHCPLQLYHPVLVCPIPLGTNPRMQSLEADTAQECKGKVK